MTGRERFRRVFRGEPFDRPPLLDDGVREGVVERWRGEGMPRDKTPAELFGLNPHDRIGPDLTPRVANRRDVLGLSARGYRAAFRASRDRFPKDWAETLGRLDGRDQIIGIWASRGFFQALGVGDWPTLSAVLYAVRDVPRKIENRLRIYGDFCTRMLEDVLRDVDPEFIFLGEPISDNHGPLISPEDFRRLALPAYEEIIAVAREHETRRPGAANVLVSTYGNVAALIPALLEAGANILWVSEISELPSMEYRRLRAEHGPRLGLVGGIPLSVLASESEGEMERRMRGIVPPLLASGRYVPLASGRVREDVSWRRYSRYRELLARIVAESAGGGA
jgi:hypothetical protein